MEFRQKKHLQMIKLKPFQQSAGLCGPASLKIVLDYYGVAASEAEIAKIALSGKEKGTGKEGLIKAARHFGFKVVAKENSSLTDLKYYIHKKIPVIVDWFLEDDGHYSVAADINNKKITLMDPAIGRTRLLPLDKFYRIWFDFPGRYMKSPKDLILRLMLVVTPCIKNK